MKLSTSIAALLGCAQFAPTYEPKQIQIGSVPPPSTKRRTRSNRK